METVCRQCVPHIQFIISNSSFIIQENPELQYAAPDSRVKEGEDDQDHCGGDALLQALLPC